MSISRQPTCPDWKVSSLGVSLKHVAQIDAHTFSKWIGNCFLPSLAFNVRYAISAHKDNRQHCESFCEAMHDQTCYKACDSSGGCYCDGKCTYMRQCVSKRMNFKQIEVSHYECVCLCNLHGEVDLSINHCLTKMATKVCICSEEKHRDSGHEPGEKYNHSKV